MGGAFNMTEEGLLHLVTQHPNRQKYVCVLADLYMLVMVVTTVGTVS